MSQWSVKLSMIICLDIENLTCEKATLSAQTGRRSQVKKSQLSMAIKHMTGRTQRALHDHTRRISPVFYMIIEPDKLLQL